MNKQKTLMVGNWKMNPETPAEAKKNFRIIKTQGSKLRNVDTVICPTFLHYGDLSPIVSGHRVVLGVQDCFAGGTGSKTGEVSALQASKAKARYCIVGHSERRAAGETNEEISKKIISLLKYGVTPIVCIGEGERDVAGKYLFEIEKQVAASLKDLKKNQVSKIVIAYEPLWAIGKNAKRAANSAEIEEMVIQIRKVLTDLYDLKKIPTTRILYGGSVSKQEHVEDFMVNGKVDGFLIGRASLDGKTFAGLMKTAEATSKNKK